MSNTNERGMPTTLSHFVIPSELNASDIPSQASSTTPICIPSSSHDLNGSQSKHVYLLIPLTMCDSSLAPGNDLVLYSPSPVVDIHVPPSPSNTKCFFSITWYSQCLYAII